MVTLHTCPCCNRVIGGEDGYCAKYLDSRRRRGRLAFLALMFGFLGCATLRDRACKEVCSEDACAHYCQTQERVTRRCAKNAFKADTGHEWGPDGSFIGENGKRRFIAACTEYYPGHKYPFHFWLWKDEAWREGHERCHRKVYLEGGSIEEHGRRCGDFGLNRGKRRM